MRPNKDSRTDDKSVAMELLLQTLRVAMPEPDGDTWAMGPFASSPDDDSVVGRETEVCTMPPLVAAKRSAKRKSSEIAKSRAVATIAPDSSRSTLAAAARPFDLQTLCKRLSHTFGSRLTHRRRPSKRALVVLLTVVAVGLALALWWVPRVGGVSVGEIERTIDSGNIEKLAALLPPGGATQTTDDSSLGSTMLGDAILYRFYDADPRRTLRLRAYERRLGSAASRSAVIAQALMMTASERVSHIAKLRNMEDGPLTLALRASSADREGRATSATELYDRLARSPDTPAYLLAWAAEFFYRSGRGEALRQLALHLPATTQGDVWLSYMRFLRTLQRGSDSKQGDSKQGTHVPYMLRDSPVALGEAHLAIVFSLRGTKRVARRLEYVAQAATAVHDEGVHLVDMADRLVFRGLTLAAKSLQKHRGWPRNRPGAWATVGHLLHDGGGDERARGRLLQAWQAGVRDARTGRLLARLMGALQAPELAPHQVFEELSRRWPEDRKLVVEYAEALVRYGDVERAQLVLERAIHWLRRHAPTPLRARAYFTLANASRGLGQIDRALAFVEKALSVDPSHGEARKLQKELSREARVVPR